MVASPTTLEIKQILGKHMNNDIEICSEKNEPVSDVGPVVPIAANESGRRSFLRFLSLGAGGAVIGGAFACGRSAAAVPAVTKASALVGDQIFWNSIKDSFTRSTREIVLNVDAGTVVPKTALSALNRGRSLNGDKSFAPGGFTTLPTQRGAIGTILGAHPDDVALVNGATEGLVHALIGLSWQKDDVIFYTDHEHPNVISAIKSLEFIHKIFTVKIALPTSPLTTAAKIAEAVEAQVARRRPSKRAMCALVWSSPTYQTGLMLPIMRMAQIARKYDMVSICDAAHLMGMASIDFSRLDVDFLATCGHKWQCGPNLTAALLRNPRMAQKWSFNRSNSHQALSVDARTFGAKVSYTAMSSVAKFDSLIASCTLWDEIGRAKIEAYSLSLGAYLKSRLEQVWGTNSLRSPLKDPELLSGITSFDPFINSPLARQPAIHKNFVDRLRRDHGFIVRAVALPSNGEVVSAIRISTPLWIQHDDVDRLVGAMYSLSKQMHRG